MATNGSGSSDGRSDVRRPLLAGGELLNEQTLRPRGPSDKYHPFTAFQAHAHLAPQGVRLASEVAAIPETLSGRHVVIEATLLPNYLASSYFPAGLLSECGLYTVGTKEGRAEYRTAKQVRPDEPTKTLLLAGPRASVKRLGEALATSPQAPDDARWDELRRFASVALPAAETLVKRVPLGAPTDEITWEAVLHPLGRSPSERTELTDEAFERFVKHIETLSGRVDRKYRRAVNGVTFIPIALRPKSIVDAARFNMLRAVRPMPAIRPVPSSILRVAGEKTYPPPPPPNAKPLFDFRVAIFDGGVDTANPYFFPFVKERAVTTEPAEDGFLRHGSLVTSAALYGHLTSQVLATPPAYVDHYRVFPLPPSESFDENLYWLLDRIVERVKADGLKLVNLSLGPDVCADEDSEPHRWTAELDALAHSHGVTFISAAGNNGAKPENRVQAPADMVNGIGVGACASYAADKIARAPYSAIGPGRPGQRLQPLGVAFGGILGAEAFVGFAPRGKLAESDGTSFSAPQVARGLAELAASLGSTRARPGTLRAFAAHFARRNGRAHKEVELGCGMLRHTYSGVWECPPNSVTVLYEVTIARCCRSSCLTASRTAWVVSTTRVRERRAAA